MTYTVSEQEHAADAVDDLCQMINGPEDPRLIRAVGHNLVRGDTIIATVGGPNCNMTHLELTALARKLAHESNGTLFN